MDVDPYLPAGTSGGSVLRVDGNCSSAFWRVEYVFGYFDPSAQSLIPPLLGVVAMNAARASIAAAVLAAFLAGCGDQAPTVTAPDAASLNGGYTFGGGNRSDTTATTTASLDGGHTLGRGHQVQSARDGGVVIGSGHDLQRDTPSRGGHTFGSGARVTSGGGLTFGGGNALLSTNSEDGHGFGSGNALSGGWGYGSGGRSEEGHTPVGSELGTDGSGGPGGVIGGATTASDAGVGSLGSGN